MDQLIDVLLMGHSRFYHMQQLKNDPGYKKIKGTGKITDESTIRTLLGKMTEEQVQNWMKINHDLLRILTKTLNP